MEENGCRVRESEDSDCEAMGFFFSTVNRRKGQSQLAAPHGHQRQTLKERGRREREEKDAAILPVFAV
jgi:hypothetical protein